MRKRNLKSLDEFINEKVGPKGTRNRNKYDLGFELFYLGLLIKEARQKKGLTKKKVAELSGLSKSYITKLENGLKDIRYSTLQRIIKDGLGGQLQISIELGQDFNPLF